MSNGKTVTTKASSGKQSVLPCPSCFKEGRGFIRGTVEQGRSVLKKDYDWTSSAKNKEDPNRPVIFSYTRIYRCTKNSDHTWYTVESHTTPIAKSFLVQRSDRHARVVQVFDPGKLQRSLLLADPSLNSSQIGAVTEDVIASLQQAEPVKGRNLFSSKQIGAAVVRSLVAHEFTEAFIRYASLFYGMGKHRIIDVPRRIFDCIKTNTDAVLVDRQPPDISKKGGHHEGRN